MSSSPMFTTHCACRSSLLSCVVAVAAWWAPAGAAEAAVSRAKSLAQFDAGYVQCEQRYPQMRGQRDQTYAGLWKLKFDDATRAQLADARKTAEYKAENRRATRTLAKNAAASDVSTRLDQQCLALQREAKS